MPEESRKKLYNAISSQFDLGSFEEFDTKMNDKTSREKLYKAVSQSFDLGSFDEFETKITPTPPPTEPPIQKTGTYEPRNKVAEMLNKPTSQDIQREKRGISEVPKEVPSGTKTPQIKIKTEDVERFTENKATESAYIGAKKEAEGKGLKNTLDLFPEKSDNIANYLNEESKAEYNFLKALETYGREVDELTARTQATGNPQTQADLQKAKFNKYKTQVELEKFTKQRNAKIDEAITLNENLINYLTTQGDSEEKIADAQKEIVRLQSQKENYLQNPDQKIMSVFSANKQEMDEFKVPGNTPRERVKNYALIVNRQIEEIDEKIKTKFPGEPLEKPSWTGGYKMATRSPELEVLWERKMKLTPKMQALAQVALVDRMPTKTTGGFIGSMFDAISKELLPDKMTQTNLKDLSIQDVGKIIEENQIAMGLTDEMIKESAAKQTKELQTPTEFFSAEGMGNLFGTSLSMIPAFTLGNKATAAMKIPQMIRMARMASTTTKYGKFLVPTLKASQQGIEYAMAKPFLQQEELKDEANFLSGFLGAVMSKPVQKALSAKNIQSMIGTLFGDKAPTVVNQLTVLGNKVANGFGEYGSEVGETVGSIAQTYLETENFAELKKSLNDQFGSLEPNMELFVGSVVMGFFMGSGTGIGDAAINKSKEIYAAMPPNQQKTADEILKQFKDDLETSEVNAKRQEIAEGETAPKVEEVTEVDLQNKQAAIEVIQSPTASIKEKAEAAKVVRDIEAKEREVAITEKALEKGPLEEGEVVKEEVVETPKEEVVAEEVVSETPMVEETKVGELVVTDEVKDIKDEVTDEKIGEKKYQKFNIDFEDGARAFGTIENGVASISGINAPKAKGSVIKPKRGTKTYERVISKLKESGVKTISVKLQSTDSEKAIDKLVEKGVLTNPRDIMGGSFNQRPTTFDISTQETPILKEEAKIEDKIEETPQKVEEGKVAKTNNINGYEFTNTPSLKDVIVKTVPQENLVTIESDIFLTENKNSLAEGVKNEGGGWYSMKQNAGAEVFLYNDITKEGVVLTEKKGGTMGIVVQDFINNNSREASTPIQNTPSQTSLSEQKSETKVETPKKESLKPQKPKTKAEIKAEKEAEIKDRLLDRLAAYNNLSTYQQNTQKNRDEIVDIIGVASKYKFTIADANVKSTKQSKKYELFKDGKKQTRTKVATETTKATPEQIKVAERLIEKDMVTLWDGSPYTPHLDAVSYGITWQQIRKGEQDIKAGKVDSVPARKLIEVLNQIESDGIVNIVSGSGSMMQRDGYKLSEARQAMREIPELTDADIEEINANEEALAKEYDEWFNNLTEEEQLNILEENESRNQSDVGQNVESRESQKDVPNEEDGAGGSAEEKGTIDSIISKLESLKIDTKNTLSSFGLLPETWNTAIDIVIGVVKVSGATAESVRKGIAKAIEYINSTEDKDKFQKEDFEAFVFEKLAEETPATKEPPMTPKEVDEYQDQKVKEITSEVPQETTTDEDKEPRKREKALLNRAFRGVTNQQMKDAIAKHDLEYFQESWSTSKAIANDFINEVGLDNALDAVRRGMVVGAPAAYIWSANIDEVGRQIAATSDEQTIKDLQEIQSELLEEFGVQTKKGGQFIAALRDIYANSDFGYDTEYQIKKFKDTNGGEIPKEVEEKMRKLGKEYDAIKAKLEETEKKLKEVEEKQAVVDIAQDIARKKQIEKQQSIKEKTKKIADKIREGKTARPSMFLSSSPGAIVWDGALEVAAQTIETTGKVADAVAKAVEFIKNSDWYASLSDSDKDNAEKQVKKYLKDVQKEAPTVTVTDTGIQIPHQIIRDYVSQGITDIDKLVEAIKIDLLADEIEVTERQIRDAITKYGKTINPNKEEIETQIRKMKRIGRIYSALEDIENQKRPLKSGQQRDKLDAEERKLNKELREALKTLPIDAEAASDQLKTSLDAVKQRLRNQIEDLQKEIETGEKRAKSKGIEYDEDAKALVEERDRIKAIRDEIFGDKEISLEEKIKAANKVMDRAIKNLEEKIRSGELETEKRTPLSSPELDAKKEALNKLRQELKTMREIAGITGKQRLESAKKRTIKQIANLEKRIKEGDFAKAKKKPLLSDTELDKIRAEKIRIQNEFDKLQYQNELKNRTKSQKVYDSLWEMWNLTRALRATGELSPVLLQGGVYTIGQSITNPMMAVRAFAQLFTQGFSEKKHEAWLRKVQAQEFYPRLKQSKLAITETDVKVNAKEELFLSGWVNQIWDGLGLPLRAFGEKPYKVWEKLSPPKFFERATIAYLNSIRLEKYLQGEQMLRAQGIEYNGNEKQYKAMADVINTFTGRGSLGKLELVSKPLAAVFFSPRMWSSSIQQTIALPYFYAAAGVRDTPSIGGGRFKPTVAQKMILMDYMKYVGLTAAILMLVKANEDDDDKEGMKVEMDPRSSDFGKIKFGDTRIDPWGGRIQQVVLISRMMTDSIITKGEKKTLGSTPFTPTKGGLLLKFAQNKLSPSSAMVAKFLFSSWKKDKETNEMIRVDQYGQPIGGPLSMTTDNLYPIYWETISELHDEHKPVVAGFLDAAAFFGLGIGVYEDKDKAKKK